MMGQGKLAFEYESEKNEASLTSYAGLLLYVEWMISTGLSAQIEKNIHTKTQGWSDLQMITSLILLNIAGDDCVDDIEKLERDAGLRTLLLKFETQGMTRKERGAYEERWRKKKERAFPSASSLRRYLEQFHAPEQEKLREEGVAFIPSPNEQLQRLIEMNHSLVDFADKKSQWKRLL